MLPLERTVARLAREYVVGGVDGEALLGAGGLTRYEGVKLRHRALLWGMYVHERVRGHGLADAIVEALVAEARSKEIEQVLLTVVAGNQRAIRLYERWGFRQYGLEPRAVKVGSEYLDEVLMVLAVEQELVFHVP